MALSKPITATCMKTQALPYIGIPVLILATKPPVSIMITILTCDINDIVVYIPNSVGYMNDCQLILEMDSLSRSTNYLSSTVRAERVLQ